jgi:hypothetical protein
MLPANPTICQQPTETEVEARARFLTNYYALAGPDADLEWFDRALEPLLMLAIFGRNQPEATRRPRSTPFWNTDRFIDYYSPVPMRRAANQ